MVIIQSVVALGKGLGMSITAEGVETKSNNSPKFSQLDAPKHKAFFSAGRNLPRTWTYQWLKEAWRNLNTDGSVASF